MEEDPLTDALNAADHILKLLRASNPDVLNNKKLQQRIREIRDFKRTRQGKGPRPANSSTRGRQRPIEDFNDCVGIVQQERFNQAARAVQNATWTVGSPLFTGFAFPRGSDGLATLLGWCEARSIDATREMRVLTVIVEAHVHEEAEEKCVPVNSIYELLSEKMGWRKGKIEDLCKRGRWHMSILESEDVGLGVLAILGDKNFGAGAHLSSKPGPVANFVRCCLEIDGFKKRSHELAAYVYDGLELCIERLRIGQGPLVLSPDSRLQRLLSKHEQAGRSAIEEVQTSDGSQQQGVTTVRSPNVPFEERDTTQWSLNGSIHMGRAVGSAEAQPFSIEAPALSHRWRAEDSGSCVQHADTAPSTGLSQSPPGHARATPFADKELSIVPHAPSPSRPLLVFENLLRTTKLYFETTCRSMIFDGHGLLLAPNGAELRNDLCSEFDSYCFTATMFVDKGLYVDFRRALSKAYALVEGIIQAEHPRTLACFFEVLIHFLQKGLPEVASSLRDFIKGMSAKLAMEGRAGHLWGQICWLLGELDPETLDQVLAQTWKCTTDIFDRELGASTRLAVSVRLDYMKRVISDPSDEERLLRGLLAQFGAIPRLPTPRVMLNLAHALNKQGRHGEAEEVALKVHSLLLRGDQLYAGRIVERIESLKIVSHSRFNQGKTTAAEQTMKDALGMIVDQWGERHPWVPEFTNVLEGWLRAWGRVEDADTMRGNVESLMGTDGVDG